MYVAKRRVWVAHVEQIVLGLVAIIAEAMMAHRGNTGVRRVRQDLFVLLAWAEDGCRRQSFTRALPSDGKDTGFVTVAGDVGVESIRH